MLGPYPDRATISWGGSILARGGARGEPGSNASAQPGITVRFRGPLGEVDMFGARRRRQERDEFLMVHSKIASIHGDLLRRDGDLLQALSTLTSATDHVSARLESDSALARVLTELVAAREPAAIDLTKERVLGGSVSGDGDASNFSN